MKKILAIFFGCFAVTGAYANFGFRLFHDFNAYLFSAVAPTGLYSQQTIIDENGDRVRNNGVPQGILDSGQLLPVRSGNTGYYIPGYYNFFTTSVAPHGFFWNDQNIMRLIMTYNKNRMEAYIGISGNRLINRMTNRGARPNATDFLNFFLIDEYFFRSTHEMFNIWFGNLDAPVKVSSYQDFTDWSYQLKHDGFGVNVPGNNVFMLRSNNSFRELVSPTNLTRYDDIGQFVGSIKALDYFFDIPITIDVNMDLGNGIGRLINAAGTNPGQSRFAGGTRISGEGIGYLLNFDLTYKVRGGDGNRDDSWDEDLNPNSGFQPDGVGAVSHVLGLALGFPSLIPDFGISFAYTALFATYENKAPLPGTDDPLIRKTGPFFNGIDIRMRYTGINNLRLTFNNNISFAFAGEPVFNTDDRETRQSINVQGNANLFRYHSQSWLAIYNAVAARYVLNGNMAASLEIVHKMSILTENNSNPNRGSTLTDWGKNLKTKNMLQAAVYLQFNVTSRIFLQCGPTLWFENNSTTYSNYLNGGPGQTTSWSGGAIGFGLPVRVVFNW